MNQSDQKHIDTEIERAFKGYHKHYADGFLSPPCLWARASTLDEPGRLQIQGDFPEYGNGWECVSSVPPATPRQLRNWLRDKIRRLPILPIELPITA
jgi:hypothetical protein